MKKFVFTMAFAAVMLASCSSNEDAPQMPEEALVPIQPSIVSNVILPDNDGTRADLSTSDNLSLIGWEVNKLPTNVADADFSGAPTFSDAKVKLTNITGTPNSDLAMSPKKYYNANENIYTYLGGVYPAIGTGVTISNNVVTFSTKNGSLDVCTAKILGGSKNVPFTSSNNPLVFEHKTAKITFEVKKDASVADNTKLTEITLNGVQVPQSVTFKKLTADVTPGSPASLLAAYSGSLNLTTTAQAATTNPLFICAGTVGGTAAGNITVSAKTQLGTLVTTYTNKAITAVSGNKIEAGKHYKITLTFSQKEITPTVKVVDWGTVQTGNSSVQ